MKLVERGTESDPLPTPPVRLLREYKGPTQPALDRAGTADRDFLPGRVATMQASDQAERRGILLAGPGHRRGRLAARLLPWLLLSWLVAAALAIALSR